MPGGSPAAWPHVKEIFQGVSAKLKTTCRGCDWVGENGAGHYVENGSQRHRIPGDIAVDLRGLQPFWK